MPKQSTPRSTTPDFSLGEKPCVVVVGAPKLCCRLRDLRPHASRRLLRRLIRALVIKIGASRQHPTSVLSQRANLAESFFQARLLKAPCCRHFVGMVL